jgi:hypothetical protein
MGGSLAGGPRPRLESATGNPPGDGSGRGSTPGTSGITAGVHPERVVAGAHPGRGLVLAGVVAASRPAGGGWEAGILTGGTTITCRFPDTPASVGDSFVITALDPPYFEAGGAALETTSAEAAGVSSTLVREQ